LSPLINKTMFENQSGGWVGAVVIGPKGDETGVAVEPGGTVWLSEAEQILTANAPRRPQDNPFIEQAHKVLDPVTGENVERRVTPLVPINSERFVPANARPIPSDLARHGAQATGHAQAAATADEPTVVTAGGDPVAEREAAVVEAGEAAQPHQPLPATPRAAAAAQAAERPEEPQTPPEPPQTGGAEEPSGPPVSGNFTPGEEVATPEAPNAETPVESEGGATAGEPDTDTETGPRAPAPMPAPYTPQDDPAKTTPPGDEE
jgi:hypothetical protein